MAIRPQELGTGTRGGLDPKESMGGRLGDDLEGKHTFGFAVPDNFESFVGAKVVVIGKSDRLVGYDVRLSVTQNMKRHDDFTSQDLGLSVVLVKDELLEIDISSIIPALNPGIDYLSIHFTARRMVVTDHDCGC